MLTKKELGEKVHEARKWVITVSATTSSPSEGRKAVEDLIELAFNHVPTKPDLKEVPLEGWAPQEGDIVKWPCGRMDKVMTWNVPGGSKFCVSVPGYGMAGVCDWTRTLFFAAQCKILREEA